MSQVQTAFSNAFVEIHVGNVESRIVGPAPVESLDRALNSRGLPAGASDSEPGGLQAHTGVLRAATELDTSGLPVAPAAGDDDIRDIRAQVEAGGSVQQVVGDQRPSTSLVFEPSSRTFLSGALPQVKRVLRRSGVRFRLRDRRTTLRAKQDWSLRGPPLRDYQEEVVKEAVARGRGLIDIGVGGGKSLLAAAIVAALGLPCIWLVTTRALLSQTLRNVRAFLGVEPGVIGDGECRPAPLTVALVQSLWSLELDLAAWRGGTLVFDEGHHAAAKTYRETIQRLEPRYHYYLSAVPFRSTRGEQAVLEALAGRPLTGRKYSSRFLVERGYCCPVEVRAERVTITGEMTEKPFGRIYREFIVQSAERNLRIARIAQDYLRAGRQVLVLVEQLKHGEELLRLIGEGACFVHGGTPRRALLERIEDFAGRQIRCLLATSPLLHEGVDIRGIEVVVAAGGLRSKAKVIQSLGRGMRLAPGKRCCTYVDFLDDDEAGILRAHARERFRVLKEEGFYVPQLAEEPESGAGAEGEVPPTWWHLPGSRSFFLVDGAGRVRGKAYCMKKEGVPAKLCKRCRGAKVCEKGGMILWQEE